MVAALRSRIYTYAYRGLSSQQQHTEPHRPETESHPSRKPVALQGPMNTTLESRTTHLQYLPYNYVPIEWVCALILVLFSISGLMHLAQALWYKLWFMLCTVVLADITEVIGWSGRLWSSRNPFLLEPFLIQITTTIIAPTPMVAANFLILGELIRRLGPQYSRLSPKWYATVFLGCDIIALVIQAVGGADASQASEHHGDYERGGHIMLGGIVFQLAGIVMYMTLAIEFIVRYLRDRPVRKISEENLARLHFLSQDYKLMLSGLAFSTICIFIRSVYRTCELSNGWQGQIISTQHLFNICDGAMIVLATFTINIFHPGVLMGRSCLWYLDHMPVDLMEVDVENNAEGCGLNRK